jgi:membrane-associated protease RseP (regulator of RpoE activity)
LTGAWAFALNNTLIFRMDQPFSFPNPSGTPSNGEAAPDLSDDLDDDWATQHYRPTVVHNLPNFYSQPFPQTVPDAQSEVSFRRLLFHLLLLGLTILTTTFATGMFMLNGFLEGLVYSFTVLSILGAHEMGHYIACRWYGVRATLPYFIPAPIPPIGTFGAFIKIKSPIPSRRALFDIGIAGPLAGFIFALPAAFIAHYFATPAALVDISKGGFTINSPLLFQFFERLLHAPPVVELNPVMWAAWVGVFMTSLNLLPVGQLDGGHVTYAVFGRRGHRVIAWIGYLSVLTLAIFSVRSGMWNWVVYAVLLTLVIRIGHPPVIDEGESLGLARTLVAIIGLLVFVLSFLPFPITIY